jgi:hypothetical protein
MMERTKEAQAVLDRIVKDADRRHAEAVVKGDDRSMPEGLRNWPSNPGTDSYQDKMLANRVRA